MILKNIFRTNGPNQCYFWFIFLILKCIFHCFSYYQIVAFHSTIVEWTLCSCCASFNIQFFIHLLEFFIVKFSPIVTQKHLGGLKCDIHIKHMLWIISSLLLVLISLTAEYLVSIKCRIQYWLCLCSYKSRHTVSLNLFPRVNSITGKQNKNHKHPGSDPRTPCH